MNGFASVLEGRVGCLIGLGASEGTGFQACRVGQSPQQAAEAGWVMLRGCRTLQQPSLRRSSCIQYMVATFNCALHVGPAKNT